MQTTPVTIQSTDDPAARALEQQLYELLRDERKRYNELTKAFHEVYSDTMRQKSRESCRVLTMLVPVHKNLRKCLKNRETTRPFRKVLVALYQQLTDLLLGKPVSQKHPVWSLSALGEDFLTYLQWRATQRDLWPRYGSTSSYHLSAYDYYVVSSLQPGTLGAMREEFERRTTEFARNRKEVTKALFARLRETLSAEDYAVLTESASLAL